MNDQPCRPNLFRREFQEQLLRTRQLLDGSEDEAAEAVLETIGASGEAEARIAAELAALAPLAEPDHFMDAHRRTMHALEVLDRDGSTHARVTGFGALAPLVEFAVENVAAYIVASYARDVVDTLRVLYARRAVQCEPETPTRVMLMRARDEVALVSPDYGNGGALVKLLIGGAAVPVIGWLAQSVGVIDINNGIVWLATIGVLAAVFVVVAWLLLQGAALAHRRSRQIMQPPLAALWQSVGHCGRPPEDDSRTFAILAISLTALVWFVLPAIAAVVIILL